MTYTIEISHRARKSIMRLPRDVRERMETAIDELASNPWPDGCTKLKGRENEWRIVVRKDYRVQYAVIDERLLIFVIDVGPRGSMYKKR